MTTTNNQPKAAKKLTINKETIRQISSTPIMADCADLADAVAAEQAGVDVVGTTLAGYAGDRPATDGPDLRSRVFAWSPTTARWLSGWPAHIINPILESALSRWVMDRFLHIDPDRPLPPFATQTCEQWWTRRGSSGLPPGSRHGHHHQSYTQSRSDGRLVAPHGSGGKTPP